MNKQIVILGGPKLSTILLYNSLKKDYPNLRVVMQAAPDKKNMLMRRIKKLGFPTVVGQVMFQLSVPKLLSISSKDRIAEIKREYELDDTPIPEEKIIRVQSVNDDHCRESLQALHPDVVLVSGTSIIGKKTLESVSCPFINTHAGITPKYRGVHGAYWALANGDQSNCGVTVHLVDTGIDTGGILFQKCIPYTDKDNFTTYPLLQQAEGIRLMKIAI